MAIYIKLSNKQYPVYQSDLVRAFPAISFGETISPELLAYLGYGEVEQTPRPEGDVITEKEPELGDNGKYHQVWDVRELTSEEKESQLESRKSEAMQQVKEATSASLRLGAEFNFGTEEAPDFGRVAMEDGDRVNVLGLKQAAERAVATGSESPMFIRCVDDSIKAMAPSKCIEMCWAVYDAYTAVMAASWSIQSGIAAAVDVAGIPEIPVTIG